ncbi:MAG: TetM/TetW/TetO/TetS family tetracycline resistance ribosomal protection protein [Eubacterium sp.]|nr:TetM/TetW/TetO/TetS family tetracycline resistance ribosomal protection protein [Eubacterium sp.]
MGNISIATLAHVDAGKTTLSEAILYSTGVLSRAGRVDHGDAFLDTSELERARGITIFSKNAIFDLGDNRFTLLDTPGHVDFAGEMERVLWVLDYAILVISSTHGIQGHTETLWKLLRERKIPTFIFVNKIDISQRSKDEIMEELKNSLSEACVDYSDSTTVEWIEEASLQSENLLDTYLSKGSLKMEDTVDAIGECCIFPCFFGSALKNEGIDSFIQKLGLLTKPYDKRDLVDSKGFSAKVYKISHENGMRLTNIKVTGGKLGVKDVFVENEKVNQIRIYSGDKFETVDEVCEGQICAITGPSSTYVGQGIGGEDDFTEDKSLIEPVLSFTATINDNTDVNRVYNIFLELSEEDPLLNVSFSHETGEIRVKLMGDVQREILREILLDRYGVDVDFEEGSIIYKETLEEPTVGVGHYEPLRHYAEVHLLMEPGEIGSGIHVESGCNEDDLAANWQRLIAAHVHEKIHRGVLTGAELCDIKITIVAGKSHLKHTEPGDFREATYRAIRNGLMKGKSKLLEPVYKFKMTLSSDQVGRAMSDIQKMNGDFESEQGEGDEMILTGTCPVATMRNYGITFASYTKGRGRLTQVFGGYQPCHNQEEVVEAIAYEAERDVENSGDSVFCSHGAGFVVPWNEVKDYMHLPEYVIGSDKEDIIPETLVNQTFREEEDYHSMMATNKELDQIFERTYGPIKRRDLGTSLGEIKPKAKEYVYKEPKKKVNREKYLLVDGYNIIFAWDELKELSNISLDAARGRLLDIMCNYQGYRGDKVIVVFDAYKVKGNHGSVETYKNITVVYTKEAETADMYIEKATKKLAKNKDVRVATSDNLEQLIIVGHGARKVSAQAFHNEIREMDKEIGEIIGD